MSRRFQRRDEAPAVPKPKRKTGRKPVTLGLAPEPGEKVPLLTDKVAGGGNVQLTVEHLLRNLGQMWATTKEVAAMLGISEPTLFALFEREPRARKLYEDGKLIGNVSQRRRNIALAEKNAIMSIFLSKNQLGMKDNVDVNADVHMAPVLVLLQQLDNGQHGKRIEEAKTIEHQPAPAGKVIKEAAG